MFQNMSHRVSGASENIQRMYQLMLKLGAGEGLATWVALRELAR